MTATSELIQASWRYTVLWSLLDIMFSYPVAAAQGAITAARLQLQTIQLLRHNSPMNRFLPDPLTPEELTALKVVAAAPPLRGLPYRIVKRLIDLGFAETVRGGLMATEDGLLRIRLSMNENLRE